MAITTILAGILFLVTGDEVLADAGVASADATTFAWVEIILGVVIALVALGLSSGASRARMLVTILMVIRLGEAVWAAIALNGTLGFWSVAIAAAIALAILAMLWTGSASEFFKTH